MFLLFPVGGELHFLQIGGVCDDVDDGDMFIDGPLSKGAELLLEGIKPSSNPSSPGITGEGDTNICISPLLYLMSGTLADLMFQFALLLAIVQEWTSWLTNR